MSGIASSHQYAALSRWSKPALVIGLVGILAFVLWTLPNWREFWNNVSQFPALWQIPANRRTILYLTIKVASPLLIMGIVGIVVWLYCPVPDIINTTTRRGIGSNGHETEELYARVQTQSG